MGTVGLSFGSPTSGNGFDVSSTVETIVSNLRNIETPWKNQLASLQKQDTVISDLGTMFSNLSNDISALTNLTGIMAAKTGSSSDESVLELTSASSKATAGTHTVVVKSLATTSSGYLTPISDSSDKISGSITLQVGTDGKSQTIDVPSSDQTLSGLAKAINSSGVGVTANVLTDSSGSRLSLVSGTSGAEGGIIIDESTSIVDETDSSKSLTYTASISDPVDAKLVVDNIELTSSSNTVTDLIPGLTFQLLSPSDQSSDGTYTEVQVVIGNDNTDVESAINTMVNDFNSLVSAMNEQEGNDSSGNAEPLYGSPTLSQLQQQLLSVVNLQNPNGYIDSIDTEVDTTLSGTITIAVGDGKTQTIVIGDAPDSPAADTFYTGAANNTLEDIVDTINAAAAGTTMTYTGTDGTDTEASSGDLTAIPDESLALTGSFTIKVGGGQTKTIVIGSEPSTGAKANTIYTGNDSETLSSLAEAINDADLGVTASVTTPSGGYSTLSFTSDTVGTSGTLSVTSSLHAEGIGVSANIITSSGDASLSLLSQTAGSAGALTVKSKLSATSDKALSYSGHSGTDTQNSYGSLTTIADENDVLSGSISIQVGSGVSHTINVDSSNNTLSKLADAINNAKIGVTAVVDDSGTTLSFMSGTEGSDGTLTIASSILDTSDTSTTSLSYNNSSDISTLANLGITMSTNYDGTISFDEAVLTSALNSDYSGVLGFFQNVDSWGLQFSTLLKNCGNTTTTGILTLAAKSNSSTESTLNADISNEERLISIQQKSLTAELNSANEILQAIPRQLDQVNQLYAAITGYNESN